MTINKKIITTTYDSPDLDGYGCALAYAELLNSQEKNAEAHIWSTPHIEVQWMLKTFNITPAAGPVTDTKAEVILLDASEPGDLPEGLSPNQVIEIIDHRKVHGANKFKNAKSQIELVGAAATLVAERFQEADIKPSKESALLLYGGILSNTQNFTAIATDRDKKMAQWLKKLSGAQDDLPRQMFLAKSDLSGKRLRETLLGDKKIFKFGNNIVGIAQLEIIGADGLINSRIEEVERVLREIHDENLTDYTFAHIKDLDTSISNFICLDDKTQELLNDVPDTSWNDRMGTSNTFTLRKQIAAWIEERLKEV